MLVSDVVSHTASAGVMLKALMTIHADGMSFIKFVIVTHVEAKMLPDKGFAFGWVPRVFMNNPRHDEKVCFMVSEKIPTFSK